MHATKRPQTRMFGWLLPPPPTLMSPNPAAAFNTRPLAGGKGKKADGQSCQRRRGKPRAEERQGSTSEILHKSSLPSAQPASPEGPAEHPPSLKPPAALQPAQMDTSLFPSYPSECFPSLLFSICGKRSPWLCFFSSQKLVIHREVTCCCQGSNKFRQIKDKEHSQIIVRQGQCFELHGTEIPPVVMLHGPFCLALDVFLLLPRIPGPAQLHNLPPFYHVLIILSVV